MDERVVGIRGVNDGQFVRVENHASPHGIDTQESDQGFDQDRVATLVRVLSELAEHHVG